MNQIKLITHPHPHGTLTARMDFAELAGVEIYENPWWYLDQSDNRTYYDLCACIGWPDEVTAEKGEGQPGYAAIIGIMRPSNADEIHFNPTKAKFRILAEVQHADVPTLLSKCVELREKYGFGISRDFLSAWYGDPERFTTALALRNEELTRQGGEDAALMVTPPDDYVLKNRFEVYLRALKSVLQGGDQRLFSKQAPVFQTRINGFTKNDPVITAVGGLVHTLLGRTMWMGHRQDDNCFNMREVL